MWPFNRLGKTPKMTIRNIDQHFSTTGQIHPEAVAELVKEGYVAILCARPDDEDPGQPAFATIAEEAARHGMKAIHIPVSGGLSPEQIARFKQEMAGVNGPVLGYCRSGARSAALYAALRQ